MCTGWGECAPPVEIGLTDLPKTGLEPPLATALIQKQLKESYAIEWREIGNEEIFHGNMDFKES